MSEGQVRDKCGEEPGYFFLEFSIACLKTLILTKTISTVQEYKRCCFGVGADE